MSGIVKVVLEEVDQPEHLEVKLGGRTPDNLEVFCTDPRLPKYEINFRVPPQVGAGTERLDLKLGHKSFAPVYIEVAQDTAG